jgi:beta-N-acetylhexosaminidase
MGGITSKTNAQEDTDETESDEIQSIMEEMTLEEKVGQLFVVHVYGETPEDPNYEEINLNNNRGGKNFKEVIENYHIGGVIYFNWTDNVGTPLDAAQVNGLSNGIQDIAIKDSSIPLFVSTDQEGGIVARVTEPATVFPGNMAIGATRSADYAQQSAEVLGDELMRLGINMNLAPTLDVNVNPDNPVIGVRSYAENADLVSELGYAQIEGFQSADVMATAKHFPGHGDTDVDSHYGLPIIEKDLETLMEVDVKPFEDAIDQGVDAIMPAHIVVPALDDSGLPATLSEPILTDFLRGELGYDGLIITDSLGMSGANVLPPEEVPVEAFKAGVDVLLNPPDVDLAYNALLDAVNEGEISPKRLDESVYRILEQKMEQGLFDDPYADPEGIDHIGNDDHLQLAEEMTDASMTLVKNDNELLPLTGVEEVLVTGPGNAKPELLSDLLNEKGILTEMYASSNSPTKDEIDNTVSMAEDADIIVVNTYSSHLDASQQHLVQALKDSGKPVIVSAIRNPFDLSGFPGIDAFLTTYGDRDISLRSLAKALTGEINPNAELPVTIPDLYDYGHGMSYVVDAVMMTQMIDRLEAIGEFENDKAVRALQLHLTAVGHYENQEEAEKVIQHMGGFHDLLNYQLDEGLISEDAYNMLTDRADDLADRW